MQWKLLQARRKKLLQKSIEPEKEKGLGVEKIKRVLSRTKSNPRDKVELVDHLDSIATPNHASAQDVAKIDHAQALASSSLAPVEREVLRMVNINRASVDECAQALNDAQGTDAWDVPRVCKVLARAREKLTKAGELEAGQSDAYVSQELRMRYDSLISQMRKELANLGDPTDTSQLAPLRIKLLKQVAEVERMRDDALASLQGKSTGQGQAFVYVSHLREGSTVAAGAVSGGRRENTTRPSPPPGHEE